MDKNVDSPKALFLSCLIKTSCCVSYFKLKTTPAHLFNILTDLCEPDISISFSNEYLTPREDEGQPFLLMLISVKFLL